MINITTIQRFILIWIILLPTYCAITQELSLIGGIQNLNTILMKTINLNGRILTIREIYGDDIKFTEDNFKPGVKLIEYLSKTHLTNADIIEIKDLQCDKPPGDIYIDRNFKLPSGSRITSTEDTPAAIAAQLANDIKTNRPINSIPVILIIGDVNIGKTSALDRIRTELVTYLPSIWTVTIDFTKLAPLNSAIEHLTLDNIIDNNIPDICKLLFRNILELNPRKIVFLFDNLSEMYESDGRAVLAASLIREIADKGTTVITTGRYYDEALLQAEKLNMDIYKIPQWNNINAEDFLRSVWRKRIIEKHQTTSTASTVTSISKIDERLNDYVSMFIHALCKTPVPLMPASLLVIEQYFQNSIPSNSRFPINYFDYVLHSDEPPSPMLLHAIENIYLRKCNLYNEYINRITHDRRAPHNSVSIYGPIATRQIMDIDGLPEPEPRYILDTDVSNSLFNLMSLKEETFFTKIFGNTVEFIDREYQIFFAAKYMFEFVFLDNEFDDGSGEIIRRIIMEPQHNNIMEFLDSELTVLTYRELRHNLFHKNKLINRVLDNIIANGYENLFCHIVRLFIEHHQLNHLQKYFLLERSIEYTSKRILGMIASTKPHPDLGYSLEISNKKGTALELLVENDMLQSCQLLREHGITMGRNINWQNVLRNAVTRSVPNLEFVRFLIAHIPAAIRIDYTDLIYHALNDIGEDSIPVVNILRQYENSRPIINNHQILHATVQWSSVELLKFVIEKLHVPAIDTIDDAGRSVFIAALDANPSPFHTAPGWWEMMLYLTQQMDCLTLPSRLEIQRLNLIIPPSDLRSSWLKYIFSVDNIIGAPNNNVDSIKGSPLARNIQTRYTKLAKFIPPRYWKLQPQSLALRRNILLKQLYKENSLIHPIEVLTMYRGTDLLSSLKQQYYEMTIRNLYERDRSHLTMSVKIRILQTLVDNVYQTRNPADLKYLESNELFLRLGHKQRSKLLETLRTSLNDVTHESIHTTELVSLHSRMLLTRFHESPELENVLKRRKFNSDLEPSQQSGRVGRELFNCLSRLQRREIILQTNCLFSWNDIDVFNDARIDQRRSISHIRINAGRFLNTLATIESKNFDKSKQLVTLVKYLDENNVRIKSLAEPNMLLQEVLQQGSLRVYRRNQRIANSINIWRSSSSSSSSRKFKLPFRLPSSSFALYLAAGIPLARGIYGTISTCLQQYNYINHNCLYASTALTVSATLIPTSFLAVKYTPWLMERSASIALDLLPSTVPNIARENLKILRLRGVKYGGQAVAHAIGILGLGFDLFNIIQMSNLIDLCNHESTDCLSKDKVDYIISLSFSCVSIAITAGLIITGAGFAAGVLLGLTLMAIETFSLGISDVIYYSNKYETTASENFRIFFHKIAFQPTPADVQELARRTDWMEHLEKYIQQIFTINVNIVAYGVGIGVVQNSGVTPGFGYIDMSNNSTKNTENLSRILPTDKNVMLLCLPKRNETAIYDTYAKEVKSAVYKCNNTFVIAHKERWQKREDHNKFSIIYDLIYINNGEIIGSNNVNNIFLINTNTSSLKIYGGGNVSNIYIIRTDLYHGTILINAKSREDILDFTDVKSVTLNFTLALEFYMGFVEFDNSNKFNVLWRMNSSGNLVRVIGREKLRDTFICRYSISYARRVTKQFISVDSRGGESLSHMDYVEDCEASVVRPFTCITGSKIAEITYTTVVLLDDVSSSSSSSSSESRITDNQVAVIRPLLSKFIVTFVNRPLFVSTLSVTYIRSNGTLRWRLNYPESSSIILSIEPYYPYQHAKNINIDAINCVFIDTYSGSTVLPEIDLSSNDDAIIIQSFNLFATINSSRLMDIFDYYVNVISFITDDSKIIRCKITNSETNQTYILGSIADDRLYIDGNSLFLFGNNGRDSYALNSNSSKQTWIDNQATDDVMDTLVIPDTTCDVLEATVGSRVNIISLENDSIFDVTLFCFVWSNPEPIEVILRNYLLGSQYRHLQIYWKGNTYVPVPPHWLDNIEDPVNNNSSLDVSLALFFSLDKEWKFTTLTLTSRDNLLLLNVGNSKNPLVAYRSGFRDIVLVKQYLDRYSSSFVVLQDFFSSDNSSEISVDWLHMRIFITRKINDDEVPIIMGANEVLKLYSNFSNAMNTGENADFIQEYFVNVTEIRGNVTIEHNHKSMITGDDDRLGVLIVIGAEPRDFQAKWSDTDHSLHLCTRQFCIIVKNWCNSTRHRLYRIEFVQSIINEPVILHYLHKLRCQKEKECRDEKCFIKIFNKKLINAQRVLSLTLGSNDSDCTRLLKCVGSIFVDIVARNSMYRLFGFASVVEQAKFIHDNCQILIAERNAECLSLENMKTMIENKIQLLKLNAPMLRQGKNRSVALVSERFQQLDSDCWQTFLSSLYYGTNGSSSTLDECFH